MLRSDSPLLRPELTGAEHLAIQDALEALAEILGDHLYAEDETGEVPLISTGAPYGGNADRPCMLPPGHGHHVHQTATGVQWPVESAQ